MKVNVIGDIVSRNVCFHINIALIWDVLIWDLTNYLRWRAIQKLPWPISFGHCVKFSAARSRSNIVNSSCINLKFRINKIFDAIIPLWNEVFINLCNKHSKNT